MRDSAPDESFLPQIVGIFYATFDPIKGPHVAYQVPENLISSSGGHPHGSNAVNRSRSRSKSHERGRRSSYEYRSQSRGSKPGSGSNGDNGGLNSRRASSSLSRKPSPKRQHNETVESDSDSSSSASSLQEVTPLLSFQSISEYVIPKSPLTGRLVTLTSTGLASRISSLNSRRSSDLSSASSRSSSPDRTPTAYKILGFPLVLEGQQGQYARNEFRWNLCFVFEATAEVEAFEPIVRKCGRILRGAELDSAYLSAPQPNHAPMPAVLEQIFEDLNSYSETSIPLDGFNSLELKLFPFYPNPPKCEDWQVPIRLVALHELRDDNWDITGARVSQFIDGVNHVGKIAQLADADPALVRETMEHFLYYQVVMMIDIFQFSNMYTCKPSIQHLAYDESVMKECGPYVTREDFPPPPWPTLLRLYSFFLPGTTVHLWVERYGVTELGIDPRRFISFGIIKGFLRRVHRWPILVGMDSPLMGTQAGGSSQGRVARVPKVEFGSWDRDFGRGMKARNRNEGLSRNGSGTIPHGAGSSGWTQNESTFTLRSVGSHTSLGVSPTAQGSSFPTRPSISARRRTSSNQLALISSNATIHEGEGSHSFTEASHVRSGRGNATTSAASAISLTTSKALSHRTQNSSAFGAGTQAGRSSIRTGGPLGSAHGYDPELLSFLDGNHHTDEIQVRFGMGWAGLERVLSMIGGEGRTGGSEKDKRVYVSIVMR